MDKLEIVNEIREQGFIVLTNFLSGEYVDKIKDRLEKYISERHDGVAMEDDGETLRALHGLHLYDGFFLSLCANEKLLSLAESYIGEQCYVHQFKINVKKALKGQAWPWHQDFVFWQKGDGIERPQLLNIGIMLHDVSMLHGPLCFIPGSHKLGDLCEKMVEHTAWESDISSQLSYQVNGSTIETLLYEKDVKFITGSAGDLILFDPLLVHSSSGNLSPKDRPLLLITYNAVSNAPTISPGNSRPEFLCASDNSPLTATCEGF